MTRLSPLLDPSTLDDQQRAIYDSVITGPRKGFPYPIGIWLHRPKLAETAQALGQYLKFDSCLPLRLAEIAILVVAKHWHAEYAWVAHKQISMKNGVSLEIIEAIRTGVRPCFSQADEALVYDFVIALVNNYEIPEALYEKAVAELGEDGLVDLVGVLGYYTFIALTVTTFEVPLRPGQVPDLPPK